MSLTYCKVIHSGAVVSSDGNVYPCCAWRPSASDTKFKFTEMSKFLESEQLSDFRRALDSGVKLSQCSSCWQQEAIGVRSQREYHNQNLTIDGNLNYIDLKLGNLCDLKCVMCHGTSSSQLMSEYVTHREKFIKLSSFKRYDTTVDYTWPESVEFKEFFEKIKTNLLEIKFTGGEPTLNPYLIDCLESIVDKQKVTISIVTNANRYNKKLATVLSKFKLVNFTISLEGIEKHNDMIRFNSDWERVCNNIVSYAELTNLRITISHVIQAFSVSTAIPLIRWVNQNNYHLHLVPLNGNMYLSLNSVPPDRISKFQDDLKSLNDVYAKQLLEELKNYKFNAEYYSQRLEHSKLLDDLRGTSLSSII
jgi:radical SAM protein with 4Fe4S-binding SPASM domain